VRTVAETLSPADTAARLETTDTLGIPLATGQPPAFLGALGDRTDWKDLKVYGALLGVGTELFSHPNVHYLSGFFGPFERALRDQGANISFAAADFRRFAPLLEEQKPRVMATVAAPPDDDGWCSLSLHAGGTSTEMIRAAADPDRLLVVEVSPNYPRTFGIAPDHMHALKVDEIDILVSSDASPLPLPDVEPSEPDQRIAEHATAYIPEGATLQTGIGTIPSAIAARLAEGEKGDFGVHSEMFTNGLMALHKAGKVTNAHKGCYDGVSVATFAAGSEDLYEWLHENRDIAFLPVELINSTEAIARNRRMITINGALAIDIHGQVVADTIAGSQFSGIGGHEDFIAGAALDVEDRSLLCFPATYETKAGELRSRIVPWFEAGAVITTPRHQVDIVVTEHGAAELMGKTVNQRAQALAEIAHPDFRDDLVAAGKRATGGRAPHGD
jgi:acyl-CoA hydrolase